MYFSHSCGTVLLHSGEPADTDEKGVSYEEFNTLQERVPKVGIVIVIGGPNAKLGFGNTLLQHFLKK